jgi:vacuolar-type H+-ATPase subunit H
MGVIRMAEKSAIQRIKDLDTERASIFDQAKEEALEKAKAAVAELNALDLNYTLTNAGGKQAKTGSAKGKRAIKAAACPICEFQTAPPHDGRTHRNQKKKGPFSAAELKEKGLVKV